MTGAICDTAKQMQRWLADAARVTIPMPHPSALVMKTSTLVAHPVTLPRGSPGLTWFSRLSMLPLLVVLAGVSWRYFTNPEHAIAGATLNTPAALTDMRIMGVWTSTLGVMLATSLAARERLWLGHLQIVAFTGIALGLRIYGGLHDGTHLGMGNQRLLTIVETVFLLLNSTGLMLQLSERQRALAP
jgi:hypothetical protein